MLVAGAVRRAMRDAHVELGAIFKGADGDVQTFAPNVRDYQERSTRLKKAFSKLAPLFTSFQVRYSFVYIETAR